MQVLLPTQRFHWMITIPRESTEWSSTRTYNTTCMTLPNRCSHQVLAPNLCVKFSTSHCWLWRSHQPRAHHRITPVMIFIGKALPLIWCTPFSRFTCCTWRLSQGNWTCFLVSWNSFASYPQGFFSLSRNVWRVPHIEPQGWSKKLGAWPICDSGVSAAGVSDLSKLLLSVH